MGLKLYGVDMSPPVRAVLITAKVLEVKIELIPVNIMAGEHLKEEYLKMNPQHTIPTLDDDGFYVGDSHAIITYLTENFAKDDSLYPKDLKKRCIVDQRLHFNSGSVFPALKAITYPIIREGVKTISDAAIKRVKDIYDILEVILKKTKWVAGDSVTLADFALITTITTLDKLVPLDSSKQKQIIAWIKNTEKDIPDFAETNGVGLAKVGEFFKSVLA